jgi:hypothetical protein
VSTNLLARTDLTQQGVVTGRRRVADALLGTLAPQRKTKSYAWKDYVHNENGRKYDYHHFDPDKQGRLPCDGTDEGCQNPNHMAEKAFVYTDGPKYALVKGGEGGGKSVAGIIKVLERLRRGMSGAMLSPDFEHFKRSLWAEFRRWCPKEAVIPKDRYRLSKFWEPSKGFEMHFIPDVPGVSEVTLYCGGMDDPKSWEGPNLNFAHGDEVRRKDNSEMQKVLAGRIRVPGPNGEKPQMWFTTTPKMNWLYEWYGGVPDHLGRLDDGATHFEDAKPPDKRASFKRKAVCLSLFTKDNEAYLDEDYVEDRGLAIETEAERRVLLEAAWEDISDVSHFLPNHQMWDTCKDDSLPPLGKRQPVVAAVDGAYSAKGDTFALALAGHHPDPALDEVAAIRKTKVWEAEGVPRDFDQIQDDMKELFLDHAVQEVFYDPRELHQMMTGLRTPSKTKSGRRFPGIMTTEFPQAVMREQADKAYLDRITSRRVAHNGDPDLKDHMHNADKKVTEEGKKLRIVKRHRDKKIDLAVVASMACFKVDEIVQQPPPPQSSSSGPFKSR